MRKSETPWTVQWHVAADGTVIRQRSKGDQPHQQLYGSYATNRRVGLADLEALDERLARHRSVMRRLVAILAGFGAVSMACLGIGVVLALLGSDTGGLLLLVGLGLLVVGLVGFGAACWLIFARGSNVWADAGLESSNPVTMAAGEARAMIEAPGAMSGRTARVKRA